jgi:hypothetical protein
MSSGETPLPEPADDVFDGNLRALVPMIDVPEATPDQQARWKVAAVRGPDLRQRPGARTPRSWRTLIKVAAGLVLAAALVGLPARFLRSNNAAAAVFAGVRGACDRTARISVEGLECGPVSLSGTIVIHHGAGHDSGADLLYSELHLTLKSESPAWSDLSALSVTCQGADSAWMYVRGSGIGGPIVEDADGRVRPTLTDEFVTGNSWADFTDDPLGAFGAIPLRMSASGEPGDATYRFPSVHRAYVSTLVRWLLSLSGERPALLDDLERSVRDIVVAPSGRHGWTLTARGAFSPTITVADQTFDYIVHVDPATARILGSEIRNVRVEGGGADEQDVARLRREWARDLQEMRAIEAIDARLSPMADSVVLDQADPQRWTLRASGVRLSGERWPPASVQRDEHLKIDYEPGADVVARVELTDIALGGAIRIEWGIEPDPRLSNPERWRSAP